MTEDTNTEDPSLRREVPRQIGPYRILSLLGEGGMSEVYLAEQSDPVKRRVALKIVKAGMDSKQVLARFESERQALAVLDHPNIATILDGGVAPNGRPYFVMEHVKGIPITEYCDAHRLRTDARIRLFIDVCAAVQHAHLKGLIHRDLKPSNILVCVVDDKPTPKIIDFGVAKATTSTLTEATLFTRIGQIVGTPQYMSPEQAGVTGLDVDTRTDIYSLGVVLYELLVGVAPLDLHGVTEQAIGHVLRERAVPKPSTRLTQLEETGEEIAKARHTDSRTLRQQLKGDLDWVVMKAIEKDRTRRYETANAVAMECKRYLNNEPVLARPPSPGYLLKRFIRRNRLAVGAASVAILAIVSGAGAATLAYVRAMEAEQVALQEAETARRVSDFLVNLFEVSDPSESRGNTITAREVLDRGIASIDEQLSGQPQIQTTMMLTMAKVYENLGLYRESISTLDQALVIRQKADGPASLSVAAVLHRLAEVLVLQGDFERAETHAWQALEIREGQLGEFHADTGETLSVIATIDYYKADYQKSLDGFSRALAVLERTRGREDTVTLRVLSSLGSLYWRMGDLTRSEELLRESLVRMESAAGRRHPDVAVMMNNLAILLAQQGREDEAEPYYLDSLEIQRDLLGEHPNVANSMNNVAMFYMRRGTPAQAEPIMLEAYRMWVRTLGETHPKVDTANHNLGQIYIELGNYAEAERRLASALEGRISKAGSQHESVAMSRVFLCDVYNLTGRYDECYSEIQSAVQILENALPEGHRRIAASKIRLAMSLGGLGRFDEAEQLMLDSYAAFSETVSGSPSDRRARRWVARFYDLWGKAAIADLYRH